MIRKTVIDKENIFHTNGDYFTESSQLHKIAKDMRKDCLNDISVRFTVIRNGNKYKMTVNNGGFILDPLEN